MKEKIYLDNAATTPISKNVAKKINHFILNNYANPSSKHSLGKKARKQIDDSRKQIAKVINARPEEIIFTSGATESNNLAIRGILKATGKNHIITSTIEHPSVLDTCKSLQKEGVKIDYIEVDKEGIINLEELESKITKDAALVSIMHVNNEIGTIQPIEKIAKLCESREIYFHTDAVQSFNKVSIDVKKVPIDLLSASGHKIGATKGIGILYIKNGTKISPIITGGGQEKNLRSGTENTLGIIGLAESLKTHQDKEKIEKLRNYMQEELLKISKARINGSIENRVHNILNISFSGIDAEALLDILDEKGIYISTGSACSSTKIDTSHVLEAIKVPKEYEKGSVRISFSVGITEGQIKKAIREIMNGVEKLRKIGPFKI
jgi:cysteine desulfurase